MANRDNPTGFVPVRHLTGGEIRTEAVLLAAANAAIGIGDLLVRTSAGVWDRWASGAVSGVAAQSSSASSGGVEIAAYIDPNIVFAAQTDNGTGTLTAQTGLNLNATAIAGTPVNGRSIYEIDESSGATTIDLPLKVIGLSKQVGNAFGQFNRLEVVINNHDLKGGTGTVGL